MRISLSLFSLIALVGAPVFAQQGGYWSVRPAPPSWGGPPSPPPSPSAPTLPGDTTRGVDAPPSSSPATRPVPARLEEAVTCAAALQIATMAAPNWSKERGVAEATNLWLQRVFALGEPQGVRSDQVPGLVQAEMERQTNAAAQDPDALSRRAFDCATKPPV
jgi:hypothetical protein